jgi:hypothetical protein
MNKLTIIILTPVLTLLSILKTDCQTLDQILELHFEATGQKKFSEISTVRSSGMALQMGMELPFIQIQKRPDKIYLEIDIQGMKMIQAYDGERGWSVEPWIDSGPRELTGPELQNMEQLASIDSDLVDWNMKGHKLEFTGNLTLNGNELIILEMTKTNGEIYHYYIDAKTYQLAKMVSKSIHDGQSIEGETILTDYRNINGVMVPFKTELRIDGQTLMVNIIEKVEFDIEVDNKIFSGYDQTKSSQ